MKRQILLAIASILILCGPVAAQGVRTDTIRPPQPQYEQYGSYSRQLTVYRNVQARLEEDRRREYRKWREEIRRQVARDRQVQPQVVVVRGNGYTYGDALASWRNRRDRQIVETRTRVVVRRTR